MIRYEKAADLEAIVRDIIKTLNFKHMDPERVACVRSIGTSSKNLLARIHAMQKAVQVALGERPIYVIEVIAERFDKMSQEEKIKTLIHEILHIPRAFGGGLLSHKRFVTSRKVQKAYAEYVRVKAHPQVEIPLPVLSKRRRTPLATS